MNLYLSSFRVGDQPHELQRLAAGRRIGFIPNALDHVDPEARESRNALSMAEVRSLGLDVGTLDLREYFGADDELRAATAPK